jgi:hypothetical protein
LGSERFDFFILSPSRQNRNHTVAMPVRSKSAINGTTVDVNQLAREIQADVANYRQYKAEDSMKKRAIHTSKDYGQFRNFVSVSQLKPIGSTTSSTVDSVDGNIRGGSDASLGGLGDIVRMRKDASTLSKSSVATVDKHLESTSNCANGKASLITNTFGKAPMPHTAKSSRSVVDFLRGWNRQCTSAKSTLSFLTRIDSNRQLVLQPDMICKDYFSIEIDSDVLVDVIEALYLLVDKSVKEPAETSSATSEDDSKIDSCHEPIKNVEVLTSDIDTLHFTYRWLKALSSCGRFDLSISFLEPAHKTKLNDVCNFLKKSNEDRVAIDQLLRKYANVL